MKPRWVVRGTGKISVWPSWLGHGEVFLAARHMYRRADTHKAKRKRKVGRRVWLKVMAYSIVRYDRTEAKTQEEADAHNQARMV